MKINKAKLELAMARACIGVTDLRGVISPQTVTRLFHDPKTEIKVKTVGKIAKALNVDPIEIIEQGERD